jgi:Mg/Co/Ni transporter MgtE
VASSIAVGPDSFRDDVCHLRLVNYGCALVPIAAERAGVDPAVLSAPMITTLVDATGLVIYFTIAKIILHV